MADLSYTQVAALLQYEPDTGKLFWRTRPVSMFPDERSCKVWNSRYSGKEAFTSDNGVGYRVGAIHGKLYLTHRVAWLLQKGEWPPQEIDHINGVRDDNRFINLRPVSPGENRKNMKNNALNKSGIPGVSFYKKTGKWRARITYMREEIPLGYFDKFEDAVAARKSAEIKYGFHHNHGREA